MSPLELLASKTELKSTSITLPPLPLPLAEKLASKLASMQTLNSLPALGEEKLFKTFPPELTANKMETESNWPSTLEKIFPLAEMSESKLASMKTLNSLFALGLVSKSSMPLLAPLAFKTELKSTST
jgi:hypothetical protein